MEEGCLLGEEVGPKGLTSLWVGGEDVKGGNREQLGGREQGSRIQGIGTDVRSRWDREWKGRATRRKETGKRTVYTCTASSIEGQRYTIFYTIVHTYALYIKMP